ncbi:MAG: type VI secretion system baseplate subunit TssK [Paracoccaceae bacterium]|nr:type VI secretion system baseplate subunit TssK [Paracoccaceae bacterium]
MRITTFVLTVSAFGFLAACEPDGLVDRVAREEAKVAVRPILASQLPGVPIEPAVNCVIDNASAQEILRLARAGLTATPDQESIDLVAEIIQRPDTIECIATEGLNAFLSQ